MKKNLPVSVKQRLLNLSKARMEPLERVANRFAIGRLPYRLGASIRESPAFVWDR